MRIILLSNMKKLTPDNDVITWLKEREKEVKDVEKDKDEHYFIWRSVFGHDHDVVEYLPEQFQEPF